MGLGTKNAPHARGGFTGYIDAAAESTFTGKFTPAYFQLRADQASRSQIAEGVDDQTVAVVPGSTTHQIRCGRMDRLISSSEIEMSLDCRTHCTDKESIATTTTAAPTTTTTTAQS